VGSIAVCEISFQHMIGIFPPKSRFAWKGWTSLVHRALGLEPPVVPKPRSCQHQNLIKKRKREKKGGELKIHEAND
jgi:hypothetical protein